MHHLKRGSYELLTFNSGCQLKLAKQPHTGKEARLTKGAGDDLKLSKAFKWVGRCAKLQHRMQMRPVAWMFLSCAIVLTAWYCISPAGSLDHPWLNVNLGKVNLETSWPAGYLMGRPTCPQGLLVTHVLTGPALLHLPISRKLVGHFAPLPPLPR